MAALVLAGCGEEKTTAAPDAAVEETVRADIRVVGSSTIYPFALKVRDVYQAEGGAPVTIESTGSGAGQKQFCQGLGMDTPDIVNSSRAQTGKEHQSCMANGVDEILEIPFGFDGIVVAQSRFAKPTEFSIHDFYQAFAKTLPTSDNDCTPRPNPNKTWSDIDPALPDAPILVYGPPPSSGTRDVFTELVMEPGAKKIACLDAMSRTDSAAFSSMADTFRDDGAWVDVGENDDEVIKMLDGNRNAYGIFGFSFLERNSDLIQGAAIGGVNPTFESIASGQYRLSRTLYFYIKKTHVARLPAIRDYALEFLSAKASGESGYLKEIGLVPLPEKERDAYHEMIESETVVQR